MGWRLHVVESFQSSGGFGLPGLFTQDSYGNLFGVYYLTFPVGEGVETDAYGFMLSPYTNMLTGVFELFPGGDYNDDVFVNGMGVDSASNLWVTSSAWCWDCGYGGAPLHADVTEFLHGTWEQGYGVEFYHKDLLQPVARWPSMHKVMFTEQTWRCGTSDYGHRNL